MTALTLTMDLMPEEDVVWRSIQEEAEMTMYNEPSLAPFLQSFIKSDASLERVLSVSLAEKLGNQVIGASAISRMIEEAFNADPAIGSAIRADLRAVVDQDPACSSYLEPLLFFKGFQALQGYRVSHFYWNKSRRHLALFLQSRIAEVFALDIHPAAVIGKGIMIDHGTGVVIGETTVVEDGVSLLQNVTLGGTGSESGDRHPKVRRGAKIWAGAKILGNVRIGEFSQVGAASVVLDDVAPYRTVVGVPAKPVTNVANEKRSDPEAVKVCEGSESTMSYGCPVYRSSRVLP